MLFSMIFGRGRDLGPDFQLEWDEDKRESNIDKHGIDFLDAILVFQSFYISWLSPGYGEERWVAVGAVDDKMVAVIFTIRGPAMRVISMRRARRNERMRYHESYPG